MKPFLLLPLALFVIVGIFLLVTPNRAFGHQDLIVHIDSLTVTGNCEWAGGVDGPDVYVWVRIREPESAHGFWGPPEVTPVALNQAVGSHPHVCEELPFPHYNPSQIQWQVWDDNVWWRGDVLMTSGAGALGPIWEFASTGPFANIGLTVTIREPECGENMNASTRTLPEYFSPGDTFSGVLSLDINDSLPPAQVAVLEQIPTGFAFVGASPIPDSITHLTDSEHDITELKWIFSGAAVHDKAITYTVMAPDGVPTGDFRGLTEADGVRRITRGDIAVTVIGGYIPTLTEWGLIIFGVVLLGFITWVFLRRRRAVVSYQ